MVVPSTWEATHQIVHGEDNEEANLEDNEEANIEDRMEHMRTDLQNVHDKAAHNSATSQQRDRIRYNTEVIPRSFKVGDLVSKTILNKGNAPTSRYKFSEQFDGPDPITRVYNYGAYQIKDHSGSYDTVHTTTCCRTTPEKD
ncbi:hypothetical protein EC968_002735 [Mortierella alpina]|nr:hypothetical protein EC968_002735 [Mortierella alpina]